MSPTAVSEGVPAGGPFLYALHPWNLLSSATQYQRRDGLLEPSLIRAGGDRLQHANYWAISRPERAVRLCIPAAQVVVQRSCHLGRRVPRDTPALDACHPPVERILGPVQHA